MKLQTHDLSYFLGKSVFGDDGFRDMIAYQATLNTLDLKKTKVVIMLLVGNNIYGTKPSYNIFFHSKKLCGYTMGKKLIKTIYL